MPAIVAAVAHPLDLARGMAPVPAQHGQPVATEQTRERLPAATVEAPVTTTEATQDKPKKEKAPRPEKAAKVKEPKPPRQPKQPVLVDGRNLYDPARLRAKGFDYHGIGRRLA